MPINAGGGTAPPTLPGETTIRAHSRYSSDEPDRAEVDSMAGGTVLEFGANWCGVCRAAQDDIGDALAADALHAPVRHLKIEDGPGRPLGRSFDVKLWPTLVMLQDGREVARVVRPGSAREIVDALELLRAASAVLPATNTDLD